jgi:hypothetical protein
MLSIGDDAGSIANNIKRRRGQVKPTRLQNEYKKNTFALDGSANLGYVLVNGDLEEQRDGWRVRPAYQLLGRKTMLCPSSGNVSGTSLSSRHVHQR